MPDSVRQELLLERAFASQILPELQARFRDVHFTLHPTMNGFYVYGPAAQVKLLIAEVPSLDRWAGPPPAKAREVIVIERADLHEVHTLMTTLVPNLEFREDRERNALILQGDPADVESAKEIVLEFDAAADCRPVGDKIAVRAVRIAHLPPAHAVAIQGVRLGDRRDKVRTLVGAEPPYNLEPVMCLYGIVWAFQKGPAVHFHRGELESQGAFVVEGNDIDINGVTHRGSTSEELFSVLGPPTLRRSEDAGLTEDYYEADNLVLRYRHGLLVKAWLDSGLGDKIRDGKVPNRRSAEQVDWPRPISEWVDHHIGTLLNAEP